MVYSCFGLLFFIPFRDVVVNYPYGYRFAGLNMIKKGLNYNLDCELVVSDVVNMNETEVPYVDNTNVTIHDIRRSFQLYSLLLFLERKDVGMNDKLDVLERNDDMKDLGGSLRGFRLTHGLLTDW